ncbi:MAG: hypothetical protein ACI8SE_002241 [Bacteroidia bacterium]|jgi:hypothetical protein
MIKLITYISFLGLLAVFCMSETGCRKNELEPKPNDIGFGYFPLEIGNTWVYRVDSINYDAFAKSVDTFSFLVKHVVVDTILDNQGVRGSIIELFRTDSLSGTFSFDRRLTKRITESRAEIIDSSVRVINLVFPPSLYKFWDANAYNTKQKEEYEILETLENEEIDTIRYGQTVHVIQRDEAFKILRNYGIEKYANGVGLVYARQIYWTKKAIGDTTEIPQGYDYTYTLKTFEE